MSKTSELIAELAGSLAGNIRAWDSFETRHDRHFNSSGPGEQEKRLARRFKEISDIYERLRRIQDELKDLQNKCKRFQDQVRLGAKTKTTQGHEEACRSHVLTLFIFPFL